MKKRMVVAGLLWTLVAGSGTACLGQCQNVGFTGAGGSPANQGFTTVGEPLIDVLPDGAISWRVEPGGVGMFAPPIPPWEGGNGTRQEVRCVMQVVNSVGTVSPTGVHDSGFSVYRGRCIQGGDVVAGVTNEGIFISISTPEGVEQAYAAEPFDTTAGPAVYHFEATDHGQFFSATSATHTARIRVQPGRFSDAQATWRVGSAQAGWAGAECRVTNWTIARGLPPMIVSSSGAQGACTGGSVLMAVNASASQDTAYQWQIEDPAFPGGWRDLDDGPVVVNGVVWGSVSGARTREGLYVLDGVRRAPIRTRCVLTNLCGATASAPAEIRYLADLDGSGAVNTPDLLILLGSFGQSVAPFCCGDMDGDGDADTIDLIRVLGDFGKACP